MSKPIAVVVGLAVAGFLANHCLVIQSAAKRQAKAAETQAQLAHWTIEAMQKARDKEITRSMAEVDAFMRDYCAQHGKDWDSIPVVTEGRINTGRN